MKSYAEREIFNDLVTAIWCDAVDLVARVSTRWGNELRCHELARAAHAALSTLNRRGLDAANTVLQVVDGRVWSIDHSWLVCQGSEKFAKRFILDVYCPGRLPQVQLIDDHFAISRGYEAGETRTDIKLDLVEKLTREMST